MGSILQNKASLEDRLFENVDSCAIQILHEVEEYQKLKAQWEELSQQNPFINELYDFEGSMSLTEEQHRILREEMELSLAISQYERREYFWIGQQSVLEYLEWMNQRRMCCGQEEKQSSGMDFTDIIGRGMKGEKCSAGNIGREQ